MDVVGGVIVAADHSKAAGTGHGSDLAAACRNRKRHGVAMAVAAWGGGTGPGPGSGGEHLAAEPWNYRHLKLGRTASESEHEHEHEDYELRSVLSFRQPPSLVMHHHHAPAVVAAPATPTPSPARSWVDPLVFLLKKELTVTDVGDLGRIILPKRDAECQLPRLDNKEGKLLCMEDYNSNKKWTLRYKWWPNNKSRMYVLESTGDFVKYYDLKEKDEFVIYKDAKGKLVIRGQKWSSSPLKGGGPPFLAGGFIKGMTPTGKRSPKGRSNRTNGAAAAATTTTTTTATNVLASTTSVLTTSVLSTTSVSSYSGAAAAAMSVEPGVTLVGPSSVGPCYGSAIVASADGSAIEWEKLPDPPAIEFSDPPAIEFPEEFECSWGESF